MAKPRQCPSCDGLIKKFNAKSCWKCYIKANPPKYPTWLVGDTKGEKHPNWKGGRWLYWRKQALIRDNYTCKHCGLFDKDIMDVDHIEPIRITLKERRDIERDNQVQLNGMDNLQTLCLNCHKRKSIKEAKFHSVHIKSR